MKSTKTRTRRVFWVWMLAILTLIAAYVFLILPLHLPEQPMKIEFNTENTTK